MWQGIIIKPISTTPILNIRRDQTTPIALGWHDKNLHTNVSSMERHSYMLPPTNGHLLTEQAPKHTKKVPVTRKDDFYQKFN